MIKDYTPTGIHFHPDRQQGQYAKIVGKPLHRDKDALLQRYDTLPLDEFPREEGRHSGGSYLLLDQGATSTRLISSPGYAGGYYHEGNPVIVSTTLVDLLREAEVEPYVNADRLLHYYEYGPVSLPPFHSVFDSIARFPPGFLLQTDGQSVSRRRCYMDLDRERPASFSTALEDSIELLRTEAERSDIGVMLSGGADSTALYCACAEVLGNDSVEAFTMDLGPNPSNSPDRARAVGEALGFEPELVEYVWPPSGSAVLTEIETQMARDLTNPLAPHFAFSGTDYDVDLVLSGQNFDGISTVHMHRPQFGYLRNAIHTRDLEHNLLALFKNVQFSDYYVEHGLVRRAYTRAIPYLFDKQWRADPSVRGLLAGMVNTGYPNLSKPRYDALSQEEVDSFTAAVETSDPRLLVDLMNYCGGAGAPHNANKLISGQPITDSQMVYLPVMWGPLLSYYLGRSRKVRTFQKPKNEIHRYIYSRTGKTFDDLGYDDKSKFKTEKQRSNDHLSSMDSELLRRNSDALDPSSSRVVRYITDSTTKDEVQSRYLDARECVGKPVSQPEIQLAHRILNLELIVRNSE